MPIIVFLVLSLLTAGSPRQRKVATPRPVPEADSRYLYVGRAPKDRDGFRTLRPSVEVFDIDHGHRLALVIPLPDSVRNLRGIMAHAATNRLFVSHYGTLRGGHQGYVLCLNLTTHRVLWHHRYESAVDRGAVTPDGKLIFMPSGEDTPTPYFYTIDAATGRELPDRRVAVAARTHNTICSLDGKTAFLSAFGPTMNHNWLHVVDVATGRTLRKIGPCTGVVRPFTINGKSTLAFINTNKLIGFDVGDVRTGKIRFTARVPAQYAFRDTSRNVTLCHGIALQPDEREVWVVDQQRPGLHVFDVSGLPLKPPVWKQYLPTRQGRETGSDGQTLYDDKGIYGQPGWLMGSLDGRYLYPETGEIIDTRTKQIVGQLMGASGRYAHSRFMLEVDFRNGRPVACGDQFVVGRVR